MIIRNTTVIKDYENVANHVSVVIENDEITDIDDYRIIDEKYGDKDIVKGENKWFMPGLVDCHTHTGQQLLKGMVLDAKPIIWTRIMLPFESALSPDKMKLMAELSALEMIKSGTLGFIDAGSYFMEEACKVYEKSGLIGRITASTMDDQSLPESIKTNSAEALKVLDDLYEKHSSEKIKIYYSLRALNNCSDDLIVKVFEHARERSTFVESHMNEYQQEVDGIVARSGKRPYVFLNELGVLTDKFIGAHSLLLSEEETEIIREKDIKICHCPFSNSGKAVADTPNLLKNNITVGFGTDGAAHGGLSIWNEIKIFRNIMNIYHGVPNRIYNVMPAAALIKMAACNGYQLLDEKGGKIEKGYKANLIGINASTSALIPTGNILHTLVESVNANDVSDMIVRGEFVMKDREIKTLDEEEILAKAKKYMDQ